MYFLQTSLFSFEQILELEPKNRLREIFSTLDLSPIIKALGPHSHYGPEGYPVEALLRSLVAKQIEGIPTITQLVERLRCDPAFRYYCGFLAYGNVPSKATFSRLLTRLAKTKAMDALFDALVVQGRKEGIIGTEEVAIDSTEIDAYEKAKPKKELPIDAQSAAWGSKRDTHGNQKAWFGYKTHLACDCKSELPVAIEVTPANVHDSKLAVPLMQKYTQTLPEKQWPKHWIMDMAYDGNGIYQEILKTYHAQAVIPLNNRRAKEPPEGFDFDGTPICSMEYRMVYWGYDAKTGCNKFRCPHVMGKVECPQGSAWCSNSSYGMVVKTHIADDPRRFCAPHRGSRNWQLIYDKRTAVERCFSRLKGNLGMNNLRLRGIEKVRLHQVLACVALLAGTLAINRIKRSEVQKPRGQDTAIKHSVA